MTTPTTSMFTPEQMEQRAQAVMRRFNTALLPPGLWSEFVMGVRVTSFTGWEKRGLLPFRPIAWEVFKLAMAQSVAEPLPELPPEIPMEPPPPGEPEPEIPEPTTEIQTGVQVSDEIAQLRLDLDETIGDVGELETNISQLSTNISQLSTSLSQLLVPTYRRGTGSNSALKLWSGSVTTDASGVGTLAIPSGFFTTAHSATASVRRSTALATQAGFAFVTALSTTSVSVLAAESKTSGVLVGGQVEGLELSSNVTVEVLVLGN